MLGGVGCTPLLALVDLQAFGAGWVYGVQGYQGGSDPSGSHTDRNGWHARWHASRFRSSSKLAACPLDGCAVFVVFFLGGAGEGDVKGMLLKCIFHGQVGGQVPVIQTIYSSHIGWWLLSPTSHIMMDTGFKPSKLGNSTFKHVKWWLLYIYTYRDLPWCFIKTKFLFKT